MRMNKLWVFVGGCVAGALGLLAAAAMSGEAPRVSTNADDGADDTLQEKGEVADRHFAAEADETAQTRALE